MKYSGLHFAILGAARSGLAAVPGALLWPVMLLT